MIKPGRKIVMAIASFAIVAGPTAAPGAPAMPSQVTAACRGINWIPMMIPDINGGMAFHLTFTMSQLLSQMQSLCQAQAQTQMESINFQSLPSLFQDGPAQIGSLYTASNSLAPSLANTGQAKAVLGQLQSDMAMVQQIEGMMKNAEGRDEHQQLTSMLDAASGDEVTKLLSLTASNVDTDRAATLQAATNAQKYTSGPSPDMGDGYMI